MRRKVLFGAAVLMLITLVTGWPLTRRLAWALAVIFAGVVLGWVVGCISAVVAG